MHYSVGLQILFLASLSFFKPENATAFTKHKAHKTHKIARAHKHYRAHSKPHRDTTIVTGDASPDELVAFARSLKGIPYRFGSSDPEKGFDCSGFVNYVFDHFGITIPRGSADFVAVSGKVDLKDAKPGDLILFTGTKSYRRRSAGHIGIIVSLPGEPITFIHSTSGAANGVTETTLNDYYMGRYIKTIRLFSENNNDPDNQLNSKADSSLSLSNN
ncbi:MAG: NlpC/P60 family protein [Mucilaginibacter sp.]|nr:NlpC/P60 family protein [Mucilaginibacter sp.]